ncbi:MAG TPA: cellulase family glycosylhydrolase [Caulobacter sp.]|nr:cellulase family glycosylhydrolase [Caulobacter sp.]
MTLSPLRVSGPLFLDAHGRQVMLRGVNLGGDCKVPWPEGGTENPSDFSDHRTVSFVGRPFPLEEADRHLARIAGWGFNTLRLLTTWEAVEHAGPGQYDEAYLDYLAAVAAKAGEHGLYVFVDFHQDVWARMSGGDGAPGWTFEAAGLDFARFHASEAALVMQNAYDYGDPAVEQDAYPRMVWSSNYHRPANGVMWSLFWGGARFTPDLQVGGRNIQDLLQGSYLAALKAVADRVAHLPNVIGFDSLNEPGFGWFGRSLTYRHLERTPENRVPPAEGPALSILDQLSMLAGLPTPVPVLTRQADGSMAVTGERVMNPDGVRAWTGDCPFEAAGVYRIRNGMTEPMREDAFSRHDGRRLDLSEDAYGPFFHEVARTMRAANPDWALFAEMDPFASIARRRFPRDLPDHTVNASHWYDVRLLHTKDYDANADAAATSARYQRQLDYLRQESTGFLGGGAPTLIGEFGIPYDLDGAEAYAAWARGERDGIWAKHEAALGAMYDAIDALQIHSTQWNYTASNRNHGRIGDRWNQEDLSIFSADQTDEQNDGGRAVPGFCRPFVRAVQGRLSESRFDRATGVYSLSWQADPTIEAATEVYVPAIWFPDGFTLDLAGEGDIAPGETGAVLSIRASRAGPMILTVSRS